MKHQKLALLLLLSFITLQATPIVTIEKSDTQIILNIIEENSNELDCIFTPNSIEKTQTIDNQTFTTIYTYNNQDKLITQTYPSGKEISY